MYVWCGCCIDHYQRVSTTSLADSLLSEVQIFPSSNIVLKTANRDVDYDIRVANIDLLKSTGHFDN